MSGIFGLIKKSISFIIVSVALIALSLPVSLAAVSTVNSSLTEPVPSFVSGNVDTYHFYWVCQFQDSYIGEYDITCKNFMLDITATCNHGSQLYYKVGDAPNRFYYVLCPSNANFSLSCSVIDLETGLLVIERSSSRSLRDGSNYVISVLGTGDFSGSHLEGSFVIQEGMQNINSNATLVNPFVIWSFKPPEHNVYHSHLSEPVCDKYNRYFIVDDRLYWLSIQLNGFYIAKSVFENTTVVVPDYEFAGDETGHDAANGTYYHIWQEFNGKQYIPVSLSSGEFSNDLPFYLTLIPGDSEIRVVLEPYSFINGTNNSAFPYYLESSFFLSEFNLEDGSYVTSSFTEVNSPISLSQYLNLSVESGSSVHCYGINWFNNLNLPYNLSDVLWEYDLEFVQWRDSMLSTLNQIRSLLSGEGQTVPEPGSYPDYAGSLQESDSGYSNIQAADIKLELNNALGEGKYDHAAGQVKEWIDLFSIPKIIGVCILALALGTVTLTLGKKKSD